MTATSAPISSTPRAAGRVPASRWSSGGWSRTRQHIITTVTTKDGRNADPLLPEAGFIPGRYELRFHVGAYFADAGLASDPPYLDVVPVRIHLAAGQGHYHVPLLCAPFSYTTYRGS